MKPPVFLLMAIAAAATQMASAQTGTVSGSVTDAEYGSPLPGLAVSLVPVVLTGGQRSAVGRGPFATLAQTDSQGGYKLAGVAPGIYDVTLSASGMNAIQKAVTVVAGQESITNFAVAVKSSISGVVTNEDNRPVAGATVTLVVKSYQLGRVAYGDGGRTETDGLGHFTLKNVDPGHPYAVLVKPPYHYLQAISAVPEEPVQRKPVYLPTYYPNSDFFDGAILLTPHSGRSLDDIDIRMLRAKSYCVSGVTEAEGKPAPLNFEIKESQPNEGNNTNIHLGPMRILSPPSMGTTGQDGRLRICDLHPGEYDLIIRQGPREDSTLYTSTHIAVVDRDPDPQIISALPATSLAVEVAWDGDAPAPQPLKDVVSINLVSIAPFTRTRSAKVPVPGHGMIESLVGNDYELRIGTLPSGSYIKDATYGDTSVLHSPLHPGTAIGDASLKVKVTRDGGTISAKVADKDGQPVSDAIVWFLPARAATPVEVETLLASATTDANGVCTSPTLPPGMYSVLATIAQFDHSAAHIDKLWGVRKKGEKVDLAPSASIQ